MILKQLMQPSMQPAQSKAHEKMQYLIPFPHSPMAAVVSPSLQSMHIGAHNVQQQAEQ
jgi:hypothetical protein